MLTVLISWSIITYILISWGSIFIKIYNKICNTNEEYNIIDTLMLGLCLMAITLPLTSLWLPSNKYMLLGYIIISTIYWYFNRSKVVPYIQLLEDTFDSISKIQIALFTSFVIVIISISLFPSGFYDAVYYHHQNIRWNEEYKAIPGLANLEDRFGFNSNYLLISALFSFRFLFGEAVYQLQSVIFCFILCHILLQLFQSKYDIRYLISLAFIFIMLLTNRWLFAESSTDIIPLLCIFYYTVKFTLNTNKFKSQILFTYIIPIALISFKLSTGILGLISLYIIIYLLRNRSYRQTGFLLSCSLAIIALWCIRNVIITGYLIYPLSGIDLFSFDWKMPQSTVALQQIHVYGWAKYIFDIEYIHRIFHVGLHSSKLPLITNSLILGLFSLTILSPAIIIYSRRKKKVSSELYLIYIVLMLSIIIGMLTAPDFRFLNGYIFGCSFLSIIMMLPQKAIHMPKLGLIFTLFIIGSSTFLSILETNQKYHLSFSHNRKKIVSLAIRPWEESYNKSYYIYPMGDFDIYITNDKHHRSFDRIPSTNRGGLPYCPFTGDKVQSIQTIEARGNRIEDGFRTKKEYIDILNMNIEKNEEAYYHGLHQKYRWVKGLK